MFRAGIFAVLWSVTMCSLVFTMDRSAPFPWDTAPSLDTYRRISVDSALKDEVQVTGINKTLHMADTKISTKSSDEASNNQTRERRSTTENIGAGIKFIVDVASLTKNRETSIPSERKTDTVAAPRNAVLLLIEEKGQDKRKEGNPWKNREERLLFVTEGSLQSCRNKFEAANLSLGSTSFSESTPRDCNCESVLRSNIEELLSWARNIRGMTTGAVSGTNFSIPSFPKYESPVSSNDTSTELEGLNESDAKLEVRRNKRHSDDVWQVIDLSDRAKSVSPLLTPEPKTEGAMNYDGAWDIFDVFSKIRTAFFRSLLESLSRNDATSEDEFSPRRPFPLKPTVTNLIGNTIRELKSIPNDKGYMLIAVAPGNERASAVDLLQRETSPKDTLLVVIQICSGDEKSISFVARGPSNQILRDAKAIWELSIAIRKAIASDCQDLECANRQRRDVPIISPIDISPQELPARKRIVRDEDAAGKLDTVSTKEATIVEMEKQAGNSISSSDKIPYSLVTVLGVAISALALTSS